MGGTQAADYVRRNRGKTIADFVEYATNTDNETCFKHGLSLIDDIDFIVARDSLERDELISIFKRHGYLRLPDRRRIEDIIFLKE